MRKAKSKIEERIPKILRLLARTYPDAQCALVHENPFQLLIATILSAQCTDVRVNVVTRSLFAKYPTVEALAQAEPEVIEEEVRSTGFFRAKTKSILGAARRIVSDFGGRVPRTMEQLTQLPGVARKTANVVLGTGFGIPSGVVVDTHVARIAQRLGLSKHKDPTKIERDLMRVVPRKSWIEFGHQVIFHGRRTCLARTPQCGSCALFDVCEYPQRGQIAAGTTSRAKGKTGRNAGG